MNKKDTLELFNRIKSHYNMFTYDDAKILEWNKFLKDYNKNEVSENLDKFILEYHERPPLVFDLTRGLEKTTQPIVEAKYIQCDLCGEKILMGDDWGEFEEHHRKCQKIDFIDRQSKAIRGEGIDKQHWREMSSEVLDAKYNKIMANWEETHKDLSMSQFYNRMSFNNIDNTN